jgi:hypothetical protein
VGRSAVQECTQGLNEAGTVGFSNSTRNVARHESYLLLHHPGARSTTRLASRQQTNLGRQQPERDGEYAEVDAKSFYEALALAVAEFRQAEVNPSEPGAMTEFTIEVFRRPTAHKFRLNQVQQWGQAVEGVVGWKAP